MKEGQKVLKKREVLDRIGEGWEPSPWEIMEVSQIEFSEAIVWANRQVVRKVLRRDYREKTSPECPHPMEAYYTPGENFDLVKEK